MLRNSKLRVLQRRKRRIQKGQLFVKHELTEDEQAHSSEENNTNDNKGQSVIYKKTWEKTWIWILPVIL